MYLNTYDSSWKPERLSNESQRKKAHEERGCTTGIFKKQINTQMISTSGLITKE